ncbi:MAG: coproporphyrinogen dehydrogenase HemZ [Oscillospiraceae bacterium]|nr:coproporphyrinogen dehydrogenase HemZ [Oscillospiraceae bacterium]
MKLYLVNHDQRYATEQMLLTLFPDERPEYPEAPTDGDCAVLTLSRGAQNATVTCRLRRDGRDALGRAVVPNAALTDAVTEGRLISRAVKRAFYHAALRLGVKKPVWGALTGVRPGKLMEKLLLDGCSDREALRRFRAEFDVSRERAALCLETAHATLDAAATLGEKDVCLYIGIPFCPTRCAYCSFVSQSVERSMKLIPPFFDALLREVEATAQAAQAAGLRCVSLYLGGGTPTTLSAKQLELLFQKLETCFSPTDLREITVEAGRPDTITRDKLEVLRRHKVGRISVNPQTMDDRVLDVIGRKHTAQDIVDALSLTRAVGGFAVNMDLIAGLPGDSTAGFCATLDRVLALSPENITVHTLSRKRGSSLSENDAPLPTAEDVGAMLDYAAGRLSDAGYAPYYLYRQKFMSGGFENVGWTKPGFENLYNICIMEELCSILAMGGGASTKLVAPGGKIRRSFDPKYPKEYIESIDRICAEKSALRDWFSPEQEGADT